MAAPTLNNVASPITTASILSELKFFVKCVSTTHKLHADVAEKLVKCSLHLLRELPSARELVFEYFAMSFDVSVGSHMQFVEKEPNGTAPEDETIADIQDALESLVNSGPHSWAPLISAWALRLLGTLSHKFSRGRPMDIGSSCTLWLGSAAMRCLLGLAASCFGKLNSGETEDCIATLLSTYVQHSPHFDWVVARLGGCFPLKVISKILQCGLKGFVGNCNSTLDSEVGILGYLSFAHDSDLKFALREMLEAVLLQTPSNATPMSNTIPYLMHLSSMSEILLQPIVQVFLELFNATLIPTLVAQSKLWPSSVRTKSMLVSLALKLKTNATQSVLTIARIADQADHPWCQDLLEGVLHELEYMVLATSSCALLNDLSRPASAQLLWTACCAAQPIEQQTAVRLLLLAGRPSPHLYEQSIATLLARHHYAGRDSVGLGALIRLLAAPLGTADPHHVQPAIELALDGVLLHGDRGTADERRCDANVLANLLTVVRLEPRGTGQPKGRPIDVDAPEELSLCAEAGQVVSRTVSTAVAKVLQIWGVCLQKEMRYVEAAEVIDGADGGGPQQVKRMRLSTDDVDCGQDDEDEDGETAGGRRVVCAEQIHSLAQLLDVLEMGGPESKLKFAEIVKLSQLTVKYFFWCLIETDPIVRTIAADRACRMLQRQCTTRKAARTAALRELLEGALFRYGNLFGAHNEYTPPQSALRPGAGEMLLKLNQKQGSIPYGVRSTVHSGLIGQGPKAASRPARQPPVALQQHFVAALDASCKSDDQTRTIDGFATVSLLLVELVSTDVMYNGLPWPDEELLNKVTMERDLHIRRTFRNAPILWAVLGLVAGHRPAICYSSVLLRALCATTLYEWRGKSVDRFQVTAVDSELFAVTQRTLQIMSMGQLLPAPLNVLHTLIEHLEPVEIAIVLKECVWNYMREHVPAPVLYGVDASGRHWRDPATARPAAHFVDPLRNIMQLKLPTLGPFYHQMFVMAELREHLPGGEVDVAHGKAASVEVTAAATAAAEADNVVIVLDP